MGLNPLGRNWGDLVNWDDLGKAYAGFILSWTVILYVGVIWIVRNRNLPSIKIRNVPIAITSVSFLHIYLVKIFLAYTTNGHFLCGAEFWIMSIYLPFGIALFQANLVQLQSISAQQQKLISSASSFSSGTTLGKSLKSPKSMWNYWNQLSQLRKSYCYIGAGMFVQLIITIALYTTSPVLQGDWSSFGDVSHAKGQALCRKSYLWIPSAFWQLLWSWVFGLCTLFKIRNIHDTHYWRLGTWLSIVSGLPGTPLWLAAVFCIKFKPVNIRWVPPMWLAPGIIVMQVVTVFFPIYEAYVSRREMQHTLSIIKDWEEKGTRKSDPSMTSGESSNASYGISTRSKEIYSMASLEKALAVNPLPLLHFAAHKDFTAENIVFLMRVKEWRQAWATAPRVSGTGDLTPAARTLLFRLAVDIYMSCVDDTTSEFPINIEFQVRNKLDELFAGAVPEKRKRQSRDDSDASPFDELEPRNAPLDVEVRRIALVREKSDDSADTLWSNNKVPEVTATSVNSMEDIRLDRDDEPIFTPHPATAPLGSARAKIRTDFDGSVFNAAESSIKYLVLTNTWRKFAQRAQSASTTSIV